MTTKKMLLSAIMLGAIGNIGLAIAPEAEMTPITKWTDVKQFEDTVVAYKTNSCYLDNETYNIFHKYEEKADGREYISLHKPRISPDSKLSYGYIGKQPSQSNNNTKSGYQLHQLIIEDGKEWITNLTDHDITQGQPLFMRPITTQEAAQIIIALNSKKAKFNETFDPITGSSPTQEGIKELLEASIKKDNTPQL